MTIDKVKQTKKMLDDVSPSFCLAKWTQVTIHLQTGMTHSCHHPVAHKIPLDELNKNPSALHNTSYKKQMRKLMLEGKRPEECQYCWNIEDSSDESLSDRHFKSNESWSLPYFDQIREMPWDYNVIPSYLEVSFSHACNFKCSYCSPNISSKWMEEIKQYGPYPTTDNFNNLEWFTKTNQIPIPVNQYNPYLEAFWKWFPEIYPHLKVFRITGGEPLMSKDLFKILDYFIENPNPNLEFAVNTNLGVPEELLNKFISKMKIITDNNLVHKPKIFTSAEAWSNRASYIRHGMDFNYFWNNVNRTLDELPNCHMTFMSTFNALSVTSFLDFLKGIHKLKIGYSNDYRKQGVLVDIPYLRFPVHQSIKILPQEYLSYMDKIYDYVSNNRFMTDSHNNGFHDFEIERVRRIYEYMKNGKTDFDINQARIDFYRFFSEHDKRRDTNFLETFPEMKDFWELCKELSNKNEQENFIKV